MTPSTSDFELILLSGSEAGFRVSLSRQRGTCISRKPDQALDDETDLAYLPGCRRRYQFVLRWNEERGEFSLTNGRHPDDIVRVNGDTLDEGERCWLSDGDLLTIESRDAGSTANDATRPRIVPVKLRFQAAGTRLATS